jgi:hypothetical protein
MIGESVGNIRAPIPLDGPMLRLALQRQRLDQFPDDAGQIALQVGGVLAPNDVVGDKRHVIAAKDA